MISPLDHNTIQNTTPVYSNLSTVGLNTSLHDGCDRIIVSDIEFLPWDNPDNIISAETETLFYRLRNNVMGFLFLIGGPGNIINMAVFYKQGLKDRVNLCPFALSLTDELLLITVMCFNGEQLHLQFTTKETFGPTVTFLMNHHLFGLQGFCFVSQVLSAIIACERCYCVLNPLKVQAILHTRTMVLIIGVVYVLVIGLYSIVAFRFRIDCVFYPTAGVVMKTYVLGTFYKAHQQFIDLLDTCVFGVGLPGCVMTVVVVTTVVTIVKLRQILTWRAGTTSSISAREVALTKMLVGTSILFIICAFPVAVAPIIWLAFPEMNAGRRNFNMYVSISWICEIFIFINSSFNIVVYYVMGSRYRKTFRSLFTRQKRNVNKS